MRRSRSTNLTLHRGLVPACVLLAGCHAGRGSGGADVPDAVEVVVAPRPAAVLTGRDGMRLHLVEGGTYRWGGAVPGGGEDSISERLRRVEPFYVDETEVTVEMYHRCIDAGLCPEPPAPIGYGRSHCTIYDELRWDFPVACVSREEAEAYCVSVGRRLPQEWEWVAAAVGGDARSVPEGWVEFLVAREWVPADGSGNAAPTPEGSGPTDRGVLPLAAAGSRPEDVSAVGAMDMAGGLSEWAAGAFDGGSNRRVGAPDARPRAPVLGGSFLSPWEELSFRMRSGAREGARREQIGFRCAVSLGEAADADCAEGEGGCAPAIHGGSTGSWPVEVVQVDTGGDELRIDRTEVTADAFEECVRVGSCSTPVDVDDLQECTLFVRGRGDHPANCVTPEQARAFCAHAGGRLPTRGEWIAGVSGGTEYPWGDAWESGRANRWSGSDEGADPDGAQFTSPASDFGRDSTLAGVRGGGGNVSEWVDGDATEGSGAETGPLHNDGVPTLLDAEVRGIPREWQGGATALGGSWRHRPETDGREAVAIPRPDVIGFRCVYDSPVSGGEGPGEGSGSGDDAPR